MRDSEGVELLQWCLPRLQLRWAGFRKVRRIIHKRIDRRIRNLGLSGVDAYRSRLEADPEEWAVLDVLCRIPISRFYRDEGVFESLRHEVLPPLADAALIRGEKEIRGWSIGCASGEEPYSLAILWRRDLAPGFPALGLRIVATDVDLHAIERARRGCYPKSAIKDLPENWREEAFDTQNNEFCLKTEYREPVLFLLQDIRRTVPEGRFDLILCRNVAFTYFDDLLQREIFKKVMDKLIPGGGLVIGSTETLPEEVAGLELWTKCRGIYRKSSECR